jgi:ribosomal protein L11 methyltransferase
VAARRSVVQIDVDRARAELAADALWQARPSAVLEVDLGPDSVRLTADVADAALVDAAWHPVVLEVDDEGYLDAWRTWATPVRAGRGIVLQPPWAEPAPASEDDVVVLVDPGRAFGSGSHESTRLAVAALEGRVERGDRVLDVGCGSGVLSVVACLLGAAAVTAIDVEQRALEATVANAAANGVADRVHVGRTALRVVAGAFDVVVANIGGAVLFDLAPELVARTRPGSLVVLSGILEDRADALGACFPGHAELERHREAGWAALVLRRGA